MVFFCLKFHSKKFPKNRVKMVPKQVFTGGLPEAPSCRVKGDKLSKFWLLSFKFTFKLLLQSFMTYLQQFCKQICNEYFAIVGMVYHFTCTWEFLYSLSPKVKMSLSLSTVKMKSQSRLLSPSGVKQTDNNFFTSNTNRYKTTI